MGLLVGCQKELYVLDYVITFHWGLSGGCRGVVGGLSAGCQKELYVLDYVITFHWGLSGVCRRVVRKNYMF
jgi:hypothetical protein